MEAELTLAYDKLCCPAYTQVPGTINLAFPSDKELEKWVKDIYKKSDKAGLHIPTVQAYAEKFWQGVQEGYGKGFADVQFGDTDYKTLVHLRKNVYQFSAAKNHAELRALTSKVVSDAGKVRTWPQFRKEAAKITGTFQGAWLEAEYELAVAGGQMAGKWSKFESTGDNTMLRYLTVKDARVSDICRPLEGVTKPIDHAFWNTYYPPNHFRCRCNVVRIPYSSKATPDDSTPAPEIPKMLRTNLAKDKLVFPKNHPYYTGFTSSTLEKYLLNKPLSEHYLLTYAGKNNGAVKTHLLALRSEPIKADYTDKLAIAKKLSDEGKLVELLPEIHKNDSALREYILPSSKGVKNCDYRIDGEYWELEKTNVKKAKYLYETLKHGFEQADNVILIFNRYNTFSERIVDMKSKIGIKKLIVIHNGKWDYVK